MIIGMTSKTNDNYDNTKIASTYLRVHIDMLVQEDVTPLLSHWRYVFLALSHIYIYIWYLQFTYPSFSGNRHQPVLVIYIHNNLFTPEQDAAATLPKEAQPWHLYDGQSPTHLIMKMLKHFLNNGGKQRKEIMIHFLEITLIIFMRPPRQPQDQLCIILWTLKLLRCTGKIAIKIMTQWMIIFHRH